MGKILVTGVGGNVGRYIGSGLKRAGFDVIGVYHNTLPEHMDCELIRVDLAEELLNIHDVDTIIHIAAGLDGSTKRLVKDNIQATDNLIQFAEKLHIKRIVHMSTVSVYGTAAGELCESSDIINPSNYGMTKYLSECMVKEAAIPEKLVIQLPRMLGPFVNLKNTKGSGFLTMANRILQEKDVICVIPQVRYNNYLHVAELKTFLEKILKKRGDWGNRTILLGARERLKMAEILQIMKDESGSQSEIILEEKGESPICSAINIKKAERMGFSPECAEKMLRKFMHEICVRS